MKRILLATLLTAYVAVVVPFTSYLKNREVAVKLGYLPDAEILKILACDHRYLVGQAAVTKVLFYFGGLFERRQTSISEKPEYFNMFRTLETAIKLDPYNMDAYYFTQAAFTWELGRAREVNRILDYGMRYRTWDFMLSYFAGFNSAYFLKDYGTAARYMKKAAELSGDPLLGSLTARYFYEARENDVGIEFLEMMEKGARDEKIRNIYGVRKKALQAVKILSDAVGEYSRINHRPPKDLGELVATGIISQIPEDPYGGRFYLASDGIVRSTSKFASGGATR